MGIFTKKRIYHCVRDGDSDDDIPTSRSAYLQDLIRSPLFVGIITAVCTLLVFLAGYMLGSKSALKSEMTDLPPFLELIPPPAHNIFDVFRNLQPVDLYTEYGLNLTGTTLYPDPLGKKICIVNIDTRAWEIDRELSNQTDLGWSWLNHYLYAQIHGYDYKFIQVPKQQGFYPTWVKLKELFRMTMREEYQFIVMTDADIVFNDLRVPLEVLLSHWNMTSEIALAGGRDQDDGIAVDRFGRIMLNTGFMITQKTPEFALLMRDWINCPTDLKYQNCSNWKETWAHEQSALSEFIRYDYPDSIREIESTDLHSPSGRFTSHYWGEAPKALLKAAAQKSILDRFVPEVLRSLEHTWADHHELVRTEAAYDSLMYDTQAKI